MFNTFGVMSFILFSFFIFLEKFYPFSLFCYLSFVRCEGNIAFCFQVQAVFLMGRNVAWIRVCHLLAFLKGKPLMYIKRSMRRGKRKTRVRHDLSDRDSRTRQKEDIRWKRLERKNHKKKDKYVRTEDVRNENKNKRTGWIKTRRVWDWGEKDIVSKTLR